MKWRLLILATVGALIAADVPKEDPAKRDREELQDTWRIVGLEESAAVSHCEKEQLSKACGRVIVTGDKITIKALGIGESFRTHSGFGYGLELDYTLDPTKTPKTIDLTMKDDGKKRTLEGIYSLRGDKLKICLNVTGKERPKVFATEQNDGNIQLFLERE
jgi:uncharacterized protein (TIGR03067 family)